MAPPFCPARARAGKGEGARGAGSSSVLRTADSAGNARTSWSFME